MFTVICLFRVKLKDLDEFVELSRKSGDLLKSHGALDHNIYFSNKLTGSQGSMGFLNVVDVEEDEELVLGQSIFHSEDHYHEIMRKAGFDDIIQYLDDHIKDVVETTRIITSSFSTERSKELEA
ncbi:DUF1428 family protein [Halobacillus sp. GSS1]|uniref:DUF1428 family protein n=1 Tax=unclassified Halobacillus TaxID=2636472 RepID=UPI001A908493|nr:MULTISPECIES: DUF1428 family protein [unclassified Halobacillus]MBN9655753.1 DUF1428 family protein [Halobacillus sp. GSS1]MEC3882729.1 DUF1428 family protein [Halobacillus sp. HZG1]